MGSGKWSTICDDDNDSWHSFVDNIKYSKNGTIRSLHNSVCKIIKNLPNIKRNKSHYKYAKFGLRVKNVVTRSHLANEAKLFIDTVNTSKHSRLNFQDNQTKHDENKQLDKLENAFVQTRTVFHSKNVYKDENHSIKRFCNGTKKLPLHKINMIKEHNPNINANGFGLSKSLQDCLKYEVQVNLERYDIENIKKF